MKAGRSTFELGSVKTRTLHTISRYIISCRWCHMAFAIVAIVAIVAILAVYITHTTARATQSHPVGSPSIKCHIGAVTNSRPVQVAQ